MNQKILSANGSAIKLQSDKFSKNTFNRAIIQSSQIFNENLWYQKSWKQKVKRDALKTKSCSKSCSVIKKNTGTFFQEL